MPFTVNHAAYQELQSDVDLMGNKASAPSRRLPQIRLQKHEGLMVNRLVLEEADEDVESVRAGDGLTLR